MTKLSNVIYAIINNKVNELQEKLKTMAKKIIAIDGKMYAH